MKTTASIFLAFTLIACGASKKAVEDGSSTGASRDLPGTLNTNGTVVADDGTLVGYYALCNNFSNNSVQGVLTTYRDPVTNQYYSDVIRMELKSVPTTLKTGNDVYLQIFKWQEDIPGQPVTDPQPVSMYFQYNNGTWLNDSPITSISKTQIENLISANNLDDLGITVNNFLDNVMIALTGMDIQYDAIMVNAYDNSLGSGATDSVNALLPAFAADPNIYAEDHASSLQQLHPNYDIRNSGKNEYEFYQETTGLCL